MTDLKSSQNYNPYQVSSGNSPFAGNDSQTQLPNTPHEGVTAVPSNPTPPAPISGMNMNPTNSSPSLSTQDQTSFVDTSIPVSEPANPLPVESVSMPQETQTTQRSSFTENMAPREESLVQGESTVPPQAPVGGNTMPLPAKPSLTTEPMHPVVDTPNQPQPPILDSMQKPVRKNKVALFVGMFVVVTLFVTTIVYLLMKDKVSSPVEEESAAEVTTEEVTPMREQVSYPTTNLIGFVTALISEASFSVSGQNKITNQTGCVYTETIDYRSDNAKTYKNLSISYPDTAAQEACEFEETINPFEELVVVPEGAFVRYSVDTDFESAEPLEEGSRISASDHIRSIFPYPTLLTVSEAYVVSDTETEVHAQYVAGDQSGEYTFTVIDTKVTAVQYELVNGAQSWSGELSIDYTVPTIELPQAITSS